MTHGEVASRLRRLEGAIQAVELAVDDYDELRMPDAVSLALDALYKTTEAVKYVYGLTNRQIEQLAEGDPRGRTALGLAFARGEQTHRLVEPSHSYGFDTRPFDEGPFGGGWAWLPLDTSGWQPRSTWYAQHVQERSVVEPLRSADEWLREVLSSPA